MESLRKPDLSESSIDGVMTLFTIGFTRLSAEDFFRVLQTAGVRRVVDVRLRNNGQLAGFTRRDDLKFFLKSISKIDYRPEPLLAPLPVMLSSYRAGITTWDEYARDFTALLETRQIEIELRGVLQNGDCFLCSEARPDMCHRRIAAEYLQRYWSGLHCRHL